MVRGRLITIVITIGAVGTLLAQPAPRAPQGWWQQEDARYRENVEVLPYGLNEILHMQPARFVERLSTGEQVPNIGLMAQELAQIVPEAVREPSGSCTIWTIDYSRVVTVLVAAIQQQQRQIEELRRTIEELRGVSPLSAGGTTAPARLESEWLGDNIPNPHDGTTTIPYYVPIGTGQAELHLSDLAGRTVRSVLLATRGTWAMVTIDMAHLPSGTYEYRLVLDGRVVATKRMQLIR